MTDKQRWWLVGGGGALIGIGLGVVLYFQHQKLEETRKQVESVKGEIADGRTLIAKTPDLEREVIIQRETDSVVAEILPGDEDINNFVRTLNEFEQKAGVKIASLKEKKAKTSKKSKAEFENVSYTLTFGSDAFQLLAFLDEIESHSRFMSVPSLKLSAETRKKAEGQTSHKVQMDVETYVYSPRKGAEPVNIDHYERKRDLLLSEIGRRRGELQVSNYEYQGARGRRDPWVDPRVPVVEGAEVLTIEQQIAIVDELVIRTDDLVEKWQAVEAAENLIAEMKARADFDGALAQLEGDVRRVQDEGQLLFVPAERRFHHDVARVLDALREDVSGQQGARGPSLSVLEEAIEQTLRHLDLGEYELALRPFETLEPRLDFAERDPTRAPVVTRLRELAKVSTSVIEFEQIELDIYGIVVGADTQPVVTINGKNFGVGEMLNGQILIQAIREDEIEFLYRGLTLVRQLSE